MLLVAAVCLLVLTNHAQTECIPGFCSLDDDGDAIHLKENCNIPADTPCSVQQHCNNDGQCFKDKVNDNVFCNCSDSRYGNTCQFSYSQFSPQCTENGDCNGGECVSSGGNGEWICSCPPGIRGHKCELETREYVDNWVCENGGTAYVHGSNKGCLCPCGFTGTYCQQIAREAAWHQNCRDMICNGRGRCQVDEYYMAKCICEHNVVGKFCEFDSQMDNKEHNTYLATLDIICLNEGTGTYNSSEHTYSCTCPCGFHGTFCQYSILPQRQDYKEPCEGTVLECQNDGQCHYNQASCVIECKCGNGFCGKNCKTVCAITNGSFPSEGKHNETPIDNTEKYVVISFSGVLSLTLFTVCIFLRKRFKNKQISRPQRHTHDDTMITVLYSR